MKNIFVYGTLLEGFHNHKAFIEGKYIAKKKGYVNGLLYHLPQGYPALIEGNGKVYGEIYLIEDENVIKRLDMLEGYKGQDNPCNLYDKIITKVYTQNEEFDCIAYIYSDKEYAMTDGLLIKDGDWNSFMLSGKNKK